MQLTSSDKSTIRIALIAWEKRCVREAEDMRKLALEFPKMADQCERNALASEEFAKEARETFAKLKGQF
ncbi:MAG: hypothetical protein HC788_04930 [Sphingopyxis sp.]|nr:hypothetical protein [Sphingopyxis sp.]